MKFRDNGAIGALLDEYEKAIKELKVIIRDLSHNDLIQVVDTETTDEDCKSIQRILSHTVTAGYNYVIETRKWLSETLEYKNLALLNTTTEYHLALDKMFAYNEQLFIDYPEIKLEEYQADTKIKVRWGQQYDVEQLFEHAIVHILRHRRQIERFKELIATKT